MLKSIVLGVLGVLGLWAQSSSSVPIPPSKTTSNVAQWLRFLGDGSEGAGNCSGNLTGEHWYTTFTVAGGNTCTNNSTQAALTIRATGACAIAGTINSRGADGGSGLTGDFGGSGGGSGGGTAGGATVNSQPVGQFTSVTAQGGTAGASSGGAGGDGNALGTSAQKALLSNGAEFLRGAANGSQGGSTGGAGGRGGLSVVLVCASINFTGVIDVSGSAGTASAANSTGGGSGGGAGVVIMSTPMWIANTGVINIEGAPGGNCYAPAVVLGFPTFTGPLITSGIGAVGHVSTFVGGNPTAITVDAAGSGYNYTPSCSIVGGSGSGATCSVTMTGVSPNMTVQSISVSGGNGGYATGTTFTTCGRGGYGGNGWAAQLTIQ